MKSLWSLIQELDSKDWDYYQDIDVNQLENPFFGNITFHRFIEKFFRRSGKNDVLEDEALSLPICSLRYPSHIVSVFYLGILFAKNTRIVPKNYLGKSPVGYSSFPFLWFLISLFHDHAFQIETENQQYLDVFNLTELKRALEIQHDLTSGTVAQVPKPLLKAITPYFSYRKEVWSMIDHGILAGLILYDRLVKIRRRRFSEQGNKLFWGKRLEKQYLLAASVIAVHNIWIPEPKRVKEYITNSLQELVDFSPVKRRVSPLLVLFGIIDTIDPIKIFKAVNDDLSERYIYENVSVDFKPFSIAIVINPYSSLDFLVILNKATGLRGWLDVMVVSQPERQTLIIKFR